ncbi:hypothetical protein SEA_TAPIOCA_62 [Mycobacterium phage Tapioca]|uniref:Helix-turn-helix DNA binding domain protein n=2 Tax=Charlievirus TaxID=1623280 RepID=A0A385D588_9CAUD|nr:replication initiation protein [Mycobacterium phage Andies]YP_010052335.1 replication initiation protein [Mycobacterium phage Tapioca]ATW61091.1 hypothetical protein SEA_ANDIES_58 [Mycobacterium phage Andies]AXQ53174.1 hypothetical protein SEA_TAPIOCA_62 [Mycobacterium phage Tapioca]
MPRIRTIKPEFFRSPDTARVSFPVRIFYQALWCWADDFGIGETNIYGLLGFAFCDEDGFTAQDLRQFCADVAQHYGVIFYEVRGRHYYAIPSWRDHQKTESREDRRKYPPPDHPEAVPDLRFHPCADSAPDSRRETGAESRGTGAGTGEQGNRGTGEPPQPPRDEIAPAALPATRRTGAEIARARFTAIPAESSTLAKQIARSYSDSLDTPIDAKTLNEISAHLDRCLQAGQTPEAIAAGIQLWGQSDSFAPSQIPKYVTKAAAARSRRGVGRPTLKAVATHEVAEQLAAQLEAQQS